MEGISDIKIIGIDETRPPKIRKEPYIDLYFKLSHQAPPDWCKDFNNLLLKNPYSVQIKEKEGVFIETWVREPDEIADLLELLKKTVLKCINQYIERIELSARQKNNVNAEQGEATGEQGRLNKIISDLEFDGIDEE